MLQRVRIARFCQEHGWLPLTLLAVLLIGAPLAATFAWIDSQQRDAENARYGTTIATQLASAAQEPMLAEDRVSLSLLVRRAGAHPRVASSAVYGADDQLVVASDRSRTSPRQRQAGSDVYQSPIRLDGDLIGHSRIVLDPAPSSLPAPLLVAFLGGALLLAVITRILHQHLHARLAPVRAHYEAQLGRTADSDHHLAALLELTRPPPKPAAEPTAQDDGDTVRQSATTYGLVVNIFNQLSLPVDARRAALDACLSGLEPLCRRYGARAERLRQTGILVRLDQVPSDHPAADDDALAAIHAALEAQQALQACNQQRRADGEPELVLRLGLEALQPDPESGDVSASVARGITLSALARDMGVAITDQVLHACHAPEKLDYVTLKSAALRALGSSSQAWLVKGLAGHQRDAGSSARN